MKTLAAFLLMVSLAGVAGAADTAPLATSSGQVVTVNASAKSLVVKVEDRGKSSDQTFVVNDDSKIVKGSSTIALAELQAGEKVTITYRAQEGRNVVINIGVEAKR